MTGPDMHVGVRHILRCTRNVPIRLQYRSNQRAPEGQWHHLAFSSPFPISFSTVSLSFPFISSLLPFSPPSPSTLSLFFHCLSPSTIPLFFSFPLCLPLSPSTSLSLSLFPSLTPWKTARHRIYCFYRPISRLALISALIPTLVSIQCTLWLRKSLGNWSELMKLWSKFVVRF